MYKFRTTMGYTYVTGRGPGRKARNVMDTSLILLLKNGDPEYVKAPHYENGKPADL